MSYKDSMYSVSRIIICVIIAGILASCQPIQLDIIPDDFRFVEEFIESSPHPITREEYIQAVEIIQRRAQQIAGVQWTTLNDVPRNSGFFPADTVISGIPYSSVKELDKFVGQDVSFYTFLTAVQNPRSVLYTEHVGQTPYSGVNCAAFYGTVCSMTVNYVLGFDAPYESGMYASLPFIEKVEKQDPSEVRIGDILWQKGHVVLVEDVKHKSNGNISSIYILESSGSYTRIKQYSLSSFIDRWKSSSWVLYRYLDFGRIAHQEEYSFLSSLSPDNYSVRYDSDVCTSRGDRACYREGEDVVINLLTLMDEEAHISRNGQDYSVATFKNGNLTLTELPSGKYEVRVNTSSTSFEVIRTSVKAVKAGGGVFVEFDESNGVPECVVLCSKTGARKRIHTITDSELSSGRLWVDYNDSNIYVKVFYRGEYGRVSNGPVLVK